MHFPKTELCSVALLSKSSSNICSIRLWFDAHAPHLRTCLNTFLWCWCVSRILLGGELLLNGYNVDTFLLPKKLGFAALNAAAACWLFLNASQRDHVSCDPWAPLDHWGQWHVSRQQRWRYKYSILSGHVSCFNSNYLGRVPSLWRWWWLLKLYLYTSDSMSEWIMIEPCVDRQWASVNQHGYIVHFGRPLTIVFEEAKESGQPSELQWWCRLEFVVSHSQAIPFATAFLIWSHRVLRGRVHHQIAGISRWQETEPLTNFWHCSCFAQWFTGG